MNKMLKFVIFCTVILSFFYINCSGDKRISTNPENAKTGGIKTPDKLDIPGDSAMYRVFKVLKDAGRMTSKYVSYNKFLEISKNGVVDPELFYDIYQIDTDQKGDWYSIQFKTAERSIKRDSRIRKKMTALPHQSIVIQLRTRYKKKYTLLDSGADGVLDFVVPSGSKKSILNQDFELLKRMQKKYKFILGVIKKLY